VCTCTVICSCTSTAEATSIKFSVGGRITRWTLPSELHFCSYCCTSHEDPIALYGYFQNGSSYTNYQLLKKDSVPWRAWVSDSVRLRLCSVRNELAFVIISCAEYWQRPTSINNILPNFTEHSPSSEDRNSIDYKKVTRLLQNKKFTIFRHWCLSWARRIPSTSSNPVSSDYITPWFRIRTGRMHFCAVCKDRFWDGSIPKTSIFTACFNND
jgi:hypothetical protein